MASFDKYLYYLKDIRMYKPVSLKKISILLSKVEQSLGRNLLEAQKCSEIDQAIIQAAAKRKRKPNGGHMDNGQHTSFRMGLAVAAFFRWAQSEELIIRNPYPKNSFRRPPIRESDFLTNEDLAVIFNNERLNVFDHALIRFMLDTAIRREELIKAKIKDVDFKEMLVHIPDGKNESFRTVPFTEKTLFWLETYLSMRLIKSEYLFSFNPNEQIAYQRVGEIFHEISKKVGFRVHAHALRHTAGRLWAEAGITQSLIMRYLGHVDPKVTHGYIHTSPKKLQELQREVYVKMGSVLRV
jgi:integrase